MYVTVSYLRFQEGPGVRTDGVRTCPRVRARGGWRARTYDGQAGAPRIVLSNVSAGQMAYGGPGWNGL